MFVFPNTGSGGATGPSLTSLVGRIIANNNCLFDSRFNTAAIEYWDGVNQKAWDVGLTGSLFDPTWNGSPPASALFYNAAIGPDGTFTATHWTETTINNFHMLRAYYPQLNQTNVPFRTAIIAKAGTRTRLVVQHYIGDFGTNYSAASVGFDLAGGNVGYDNSVVHAGTSASATITNAAMINLGSGWWLCYFDSFTVDNLPLYMTTFLIDNGSGTAARSVNYAGDGTSGLYIWWASMMPTGAWNLHTQAFFDDFNSPSTIDFGHTLNPGFNWYATHWPNCQMVGFAFKTPPDADLTKISVANSVLTWIDTTTNPALYIYTANPTNSPSPGVFTGQTFQPPWFAETRMAWAPEPSATFTWPAYWSNSIEGMSGSASSFGECDFVEALIDGHNSNPAGAGDGIFVLTAPSTQVLHIVAGYQFKPIGAVSFTNFNNYGFLWLTATPANQNSGIIMTFFNGVFVNDQTAIYSNSSPVATTAEPQHYALILAGGNVADGSRANQPTYFDFVRLTTT